MQNFLNNPIDRHFVRNAVRALVVSPFVATMCLADEPTLPEQFGIGREPDASEIERWDIDITPDGYNLPSGQGTIADGEQVYLFKCLSCHGPEGKGGINDQLVGEFNPDNNFSHDASLPRTIGNYWPYATTLYDYINRAMPMVTPGTLSADEVYSLIAYLLYLNGIIEENTTLDAEALLSIEMPARALFYWSDEAMELTAPGTAPDPE